MSGALKRDEWETVRLGDVCEVNPSKKFNVTISDDLNVGFLPMEAVSNEGDILRIDTRKYGEVKKGFSGFQDGDVLIAKITPCMENGKGALVSGMPCGIGFGSTEFHVLRPDTSKCHAKFIFHIMENPLLRQDFARKMTGSAGQRRLPKEVLQKLEIPLPPLDIQRQIADTLDKVTELITLRKTQLKKLDELVKARFVELFGTIHNNKFGYEIKTLQDVCEQIKDGTHQTPTYTDDSVNGYKFLSSKDVTTGKIDWTHLKYIPEELHNELYARIAPRKGDILLAKNGTTGIAAIVDREEIFDIYVSLALLRPIEINSVYLWAAINSVETKQQFDASLKGIGVPNLHLGEIKKARIIVPPVEEQNQFATFVEQTDKSKSVIQQSLDTLETLKKSLMQEYFG